MTSLRSLHVDGAAFAGISPRCLCPALPATRFYCGGIGDSGPSTSSSQSQSADTTDSRVGVTGDNATILKDNTLSGTINITNADADVAKAALATATAFANRTVDAVGLLASNQNSYLQNTLSSVETMATGSNKIAAEVAQSQAAFVEVASGQKNVMYVLAAGGIAALAGVLILANRKSK